MNLPLIYIVILNWKNPEDTLDCLKSLEKISYKNYKICLIDNYSCDDSVKLINEWLKTSSYSYTKYEVTNTSLENIDFSKNCQFIVNNENSGFAKGSNIGIDMALTIQADLVLLLNNDTILNENFLDILISQRLKHPKFSVLTPQIRYYTPNDRIWNCGGKLILGGFWKKYYYDKAHIKNIKENNPIKQISFVTGCALLYDPKEMGKLTEDFFFGEEDFEFSLRARKLNKKIGCVMDSIIYHKVGSSLNQVNTIGKRYIHILNRLINTRRNNFNLFWPFLAFGIVFYNFLALLTKEKMKLNSAIRYSYSLLRESLELDKVTKDKFINTLYNKRW